MSADPRFPQRFSENRPNVNRPASAGSARSQQRPPMLKPITPPPSPTRDAKRTKVAAEEREGVLEKSEETQKEGDVLRKTADSPRTNALLCDESMPPDDDNDKGKERKDKDTAKK